ncbi:hypothetical protein HDU82_002530 [Entophlyctis luteolus]|nr:hypothetical protein HDU82_002530 [Entophlyctis luteolus]
MFHIYGLIAAVHLFFLRGCTTVIFPNFELTLYLRALEKYRVNLSHVVPPILLLLAKSPEVDKFKFPYLKGFFSAAAPLSPEVANAVRKRFGVDVSQVPPAELEACLLEHPAVADCAVIGQPDESAGEVPRAFVVLKVCPVPFEANESTKSKSSQPGLQCTESEIDRFVQTRVAPHKRLRGGVVFIKGIPRSASGKILRRVLRDQDASVAGRGGTAKL